MAQVTLRNVRKIYPPNGFEAVTPTSFDIKDGEFVVLVGPPSGCGKSTLLRMVAGGLEDITEGQLAIGDRVVNEVDPADRDIAMVFQNYALYPHMTVRKNIGYGLKNRKTPADEIEAKVQEAAKMLNLTDYLDRKPSQLSGGQRQRVAMGRAVVRDPSLFLFDEPPLSNLDAKLRHQMRIEIKALQRRLGVTSIYVTHDQVEAMTMADRIIVLNGGKIEQIGTPAEIYHAPPASTFVASFMGGAPPMNLINARVEGGHVMINGGATALAPADGGRVTLPWAFAPPKMLSCRRRATCPSALISLRNWGGRIACCTASWLTSPLPSMWPKTRQRSTARFAWPSNPRRCASSTRTREKHCDHHHSAGAPPRGDRCRTGAHPVCPPRTAEAHREILGEVPAMNAVQLGGGAASARRLPAEFTVAAWNVERCLFPPEATAEHLAPPIAPNIVLLSEVDHGMARTSQRHTTEAMANALGMQYASGGRVPRARPGRPPHRTRLLLG